MGLTQQSTGIAAADSGLHIVKSGDDKVIALAGNPNVGKSTVFNSLTGLNQHTGNWPGKTVSNAQGKYTHRNKNFILVDIPGTYSLMASSVEEEVARDFVCFGQPDMVVVVADATCLERNLNLVLQILEITRKVVVCVNLLDEAQKKKIHIDLDELSLQLGVPVIGTSARAGTGLTELMDAVYEVAFDIKKTFDVKVRYSNVIEEAVGLLAPAVTDAVENKIDARWVSLKLLDGDVSLHKALTTYLGFDLLQTDAVCTGLKQAQQLLHDNSITGDTLRDSIVFSLVAKSEEIYKHCVYLENRSYNDRDRKIDKLLTSKATGIPVMILLLGVIFWLTITGANYPSALLSALFSSLQNQLTVWFQSMGAPEWL